MSHLKLAALVAAAVLAATAQAQIDLTQLRPEIRPVPAQQIERVNAASGLTDCFWAATISRETLNMVLPDSHAVYWLAQFRLPEGAQLRLEGRYPKARLMSFNSYDSQGAPVDRLNDVMTVPMPGSSNPFVPGASRADARRDYQVKLAERNLVAGVPIDEATREPSTLYLPRGADRHQLWYRVYLPDRGQDVRGGEPLPTPVLQMADGRELRGESLCRTVNVREGIVNDVGLRAEALRPLLNLRGPDIRSPYHPAQNPVEWGAFFNPTLSALALVAGTPQEGLRELVDPARRGGFYSTLDNSYMSTYVDRRHGALLVVQAQAPVTPRTLGGEPRMQDAQLRYWSICKYRSLADTAVDGCLADEEIPLDAQERFTVVLSSAADRPANARPECGIAWLDWGQAGDGIGNPDGGFLIMRQTLPAQDFKQSISATRKPGEERDLLGPFYPRTRYMSREAFERQGC